MALVSEVKNVFKLLRELCKGKSKLLRKIGEDYEEVLLNDLNLIPSQYEDEIMVWVNVVKIVLNNIKFVEIGIALGKLCDKNAYLKDSLTMNIDVYARIESIINGLNIKQVDKARIMNIVKKFKPLCDVVREVLKDVVGFVNKVGLLNSGCVSNSASDELDKVLDL